MEGRGGDNASRLASGADETPELHFGAKVALLVLATIVSLVVVATLVDYQLESAARREAAGDDEGHESDTSGSKGNSLWDWKRKQQQQQAKKKKKKKKKKEQQVGNLRDYRSLSMSSNCSSNLFCSTSSVASSSAPILGAGNSVVGATKPTNGTSSQQRQQHYGANLQLHFNQQSSISNGSSSSCGNESAESGAPLCAKNQNHCGADNQQRRQQQQQSTSISIASVRSAIVREDQSELGMKCASNRTGCSPHLACQILLAFSLRQSARQIFEQAPPEKSTKRVGEEEEEQTSHTSQEAVRSEAQRHNARSESVSSLHGLRFLSMIWVIVIHSYNFALRWMFFSNTTTLDNIYKSAASQLIANGSFACDSFFFAGGFLLSYLAYPPASQPPTSRGDAPDNQRNGRAAAAADHEAPRIEKDNSGAQVYHERPTCCCRTCPREEQRCARTGASSGSSSGGGGGGQQKREPHTNEPEAAVTITIISADEDNTSPRVPPPAPPASLPSTSFEAAQRQVACGARNQKSAPTSKQSARTQQITCKQIVANICHRYARMMPLMMAIIGLCSTLLRYLGDGPLWQESTMMYDDWCRKNWWTNALFLHNFVHRENMCLSHSWYSAVDFQLFLVGQLVLWLLGKSRRLGCLLLLALISGAPLLTMALTLRHHLPAVPLVTNVSEETMNLYYGEIYIMPSARASPYFIGMLLAYLLRSTRLAHWRPRRWQLALGWLLSLGVFGGVLMAMRPAMNGRALSELESALYSGWSRPLWACATGWMIFACMTRHGGPIGRLLGSRLFVPLSKLTYPAFLIHPIVMALFYGSRATSFQFSHYLMLYLILGNIVITYASAFVLASLFELPLLSIERALSKRLFR